MNNKIEIESPYNLKKILFQRHYPGYLYRREVIDCSDIGDGDLEMINCYSTDSGHWIGNAKEARFLCKKKGLCQIQKAKPDHCVCSIGFNEKEKRWYGWSHRAICGFGIGNQLFQEHFGNEKTLFVEHGEKTIETLDEAKESAIRFAASVS